MMGVFGHPCILRLLPELVGCCVAATLNHGKPSENDVLLPEEVIIPESHLLCWCLAVLDARL